MQVLEYCLCGSRDVEVLKNGNIYCFECQGDYARVEQSIDWNKLEEMMKELSVGSSKQATDRNAAN